MAIVQRKDTYTSLKIQPELFSDFYTDFDLHPTKNDLVRYTNEEAVKRSIKNLLSTNRGDRLFNRELGSDIRSMLFEHATPATESAIEDLIRTTIDNYEPRARIESVDVSTDMDEHLMVATIVFTVINKQEPITLELILNRIR